MAGFDERPGADDWRLRRRWWWLAIAGTNRSRFAGGWSDRHTQGDGRDDTRSVSRRLSRRLSRRIAGRQPDGS
jgi:hypothetical protein